ncbi:MAG: [acyl-carrier-protein] S-malonyltransferase, partial [Nitrospirae bacterium]
MNIAFVFPGQGSQHVGMGKALYEYSPIVRNLYKNASSILNYDVAKLSFWGPKEELDKTVNTQPCLFVASIAAYLVLKEKGIAPECVAGHSLGEYSAVVAAGVASFEEVLPVVEKRAIFMQEAVPEGKGLMAAILGMDREKLDRICKDVEGIVSMANLNCPGQIVVSGEKDAVEIVMKEALNRGAKRAIALSVSVPSHSPLMEPVCEKLSKELDKIDFKDPSTCFVNNVGAEVLKKGSDIKDSLVKQLSSPVLWEDSIITMSNMVGIDTFIEVGPGKVLS